VRIFFVLLVGLVGLWGLPGEVSAQGFLGGDARSGISGLPVACGSGGIGMPSIYLGWLEHPKGSTWVIQRRNDTGTAPWSLRGLWVSASQEVVGCDGFGFLVSGSIFVPQRASGTWFRSPRTEKVDFNIPSYDWWSIDGLVTSRISGSFELLAGVRWDHTSTRVRFADDTDDDYILNAYLPLVGVQVAQRSCNGKLLVRFMGAPVAFGKLKYHYWTGTNYSESGDFDLTKSYLVEFFADYQRAVTSNLTAGVFVKWNSLTVKTREQHLSGSSTDPTSWAVGIQSVVIGGSVSVGFSSPL
jgi:hypothetical protein